MKLSDEKYARLKALLKKGKACTPAEKAELEALKAEKSGGGAKNDFAWYSKYPDLITDAAKVSQNFLPGTDFIANDFGRVFKVTGGLSFSVIMTPGRCENPSDGFNMQAKAQWAKLHKNYRGLGGYESADLGIMYFAVAQVFALIAEAERLYGIVNYWDARNRNLPALYEDMLRFNLNDLRANLADYRYRLNTIINKAKILTVVKDIDAFTDYDRIFSNVFEDRNEKRSQIFIYTNDYKAWMWTPTMTNGSALTRTGCVMVTGESTFRASNFLDWIESLVDALILDDDVNRMISDTLNAYSSDQLLTVANMPSDYTVVPVYDELRSLQMHNLDVLGSQTKLYNGLKGPIQSWTPDVAYAGQLVIFQYDNVIKFMPFISEAGNTFVQYSKEMVPAVAASTVYGEFDSVNSLKSTNGFIWSTPVIVDSWKDITPEELTEASRLKFEVEDEQFTDTSGSSAVCLIPKIVGFGAYICQNARVFVYTGNGSYSNSDIHTKIVGKWDGSSSGYTTTATLNFLTTCFLSQVDNHPLMVASVAGGPYNVPNTADYSMFGDVENFVKLSVQTLTRISDTCILSLWKFPDSLVK